jgi:hypothetical protein
LLRYNEQTGEMEEVSGNFYGSDNPASHEKLWLTGPDHENATIRKLPDVQPAGRAALTAYARNNEVFLLSKASASNKSKFVVKS